MAPKEIIYKKLRGKPLFKDSPYFIGGVLRENERKTHL